MQSPPDDWPQVKELFKAAVDLPPRERIALLNRADTKIRREVESLLESDAQSDNLFESPIAALPFDLWRDREDEESIGCRLGAYEIVREIGRGGLGVVYLAERADEQFQKQVAIKLIKRGLDTDEIQRRFRNERQILATLDHPNIARLLDAGTTESGLSYFVMEYIEGQSITSHCIENKLPVRERLKVFRTVCAAVGYAHQRLVIHRDLKPSNILVTHDGTLKLLDFGIAKLLGPGDSAGTIPELRVMTPDYASPEQVRGETMTTASDVYSLGVILYELLTGAKPYEIGNRTSAEIERAIVQQEATRPSTTVAKRNGNSKVQIRNSKLLKGDLDNIVLKAIRKEQARRYPSVGQFSEDIRRHLEGLPVRAGKDTFRYRAGKFVARNRLGVVATLLILVSLVGGLIATAWQARATRVEKARTQSINAFLEETLNYADPVVNLPRDNSREITMSEVLDFAANRLGGEEFANQPEVRARLERIIAHSYFNQGRYDLARRHLHQYVDLETQLYGGSRTKTLIASADRAALLFEQGQLSEAEKIFREVLPSLRAEQQKRAIETEALVGALNDFGYLRRTQGYSKEAEALFRETLALSPQLTSESRYLIGTTRSTLASTLADQGRFAEALQIANEAVAEYRQRGQVVAPDFGFALTILGGLLIDAGDFDQADGYLAQAEAIFRKHLVPANLWLGDNLRNQASSFYEQGRYAESLRKIEEALKIYREGFGAHYDNYPTALIIQGLSLTKTGQPIRGEAILRDALKLRRESLPPGHFWVALAEGALGEDLTIEQYYPEAEPLLLESYRSLQNSQGASNPRTRLALKRLITLFENSGRPSEADKYRVLLYPK